MKLVFNLQHCIQYSIKQLQSLTQNVQYIALKKFMFLFFCLFVFLVHKLSRHCGVQTSSTNPDVLCLTRAVKTV